MTPPTRMGRPPALTQEDIALAVIDVGFTGLTVAAVRERLGVGQTTLYRYAADRDELVRIGLDHLLRLAAWPSPVGPWREVLAQHALTLWDLWAMHPGSAAELDRGAIPRSTAALVEQLCATLIRQGFTAGNAIFACDIVFDMVTDNRRDLEHLAERAGLGGPPPAGNPPDDYPNRDRSAAGHSITEEEQRNIREAMETAFSTEPRTWFIRKLNVVLDGIEHSLGPREIRGGAPGNAARRPPEAPAP